MIPILSECALCGYVRICAQELQYLSYINLIARLLGGRVRGKTRAWYRLLVHALLNLDFPGYQIFSAHGWYAMKSQSTCPAQYSAWLYSIAF